LKIPAGRIPKKNAPSRIGGWLQPEKEHLPHPAGKQAPPFLALRIKSPCFIPMMEYHYFNTSKLPEWEIPRIALANSPAVGGSQTFIRSEAYETFQLDYLIDHAAVRRRDFTGRLQLEDPAAIHRPSSNQRASHRTGERDR